MHFLFYLNDAAPINTALLCSQTDRDDHCPRCHQSQANEKLGVIFIQRLSFCSCSKRLWQLPVRVWREYHACIWHQKIQGRSVWKLSWFPIDLIVFLWEPVRRLCVLPPSWWWCKHFSAMRGVLCAPCFSRAHRYHPIPITLVGAALSIFPQVSI